MMKGKKFALFCTLIMGLSFFYLNGHIARVEARAIHVYFEGEQLTFPDTDPILIDNRTMVPFRTIFETLGFEVEWIDGDIRKAIGKKEGLTIELTIDSDKAVVNGNTVELDVPAQIHQGRTLVPLRFVSENSGYVVYFADQGGIFIIGIGDTAESADPGIQAEQPQSPSASEKEEPYVVKGRAVNSQGQPLPFVEVYADNTFLYNSNILGITDEQGNYRIELPEAHTTYRMGAQAQVEFDGEMYTFNLEVEPDRPFSASTGAVRDFVMDINIGDIELYSWDYEYPGDEDAPWLEMHEVELTLKPVGKLADGSTGRQIIGFPIYHDGPRLMEVPIGVYEISAIWKPKNYKAVPLLVGIRNTEQYGESVTAHFTSHLTGYYRIQLEVKFP